ncbi:MAG: CCA tRNA nucleotidyltransferase [Acidobacteria bacterium]|nr:CCA tRNA nucleotidyltransferase [Acidobacteriota bacterium]
MENFLEQFPSVYAAQAFQIAQKLRHAGYRVLICGGTVRDYLLGRPRWTADIDLATNARPEQVRQLFPEAVEVGAQFGVTMIPWEGKNMEVATFRQDAEYRDGRHPTSIRFANEVEDALRRDFTVNAMFLDPFNGQLLDYVEGRGDLQRRILRTVGDPDTRFSEDRLRIVRAVRFAAQLDFEVEAATWRVVRERAREAATVSNERIRVELEKILTSANAAPGLDLLRDSGLLKVLLPEVLAMIGVQQPPEFHPEGDVYQHTRLMFEKAARTLNASLAWGILLHDVGKPPTFQIKDRIRFDSHVEVGCAMTREIGKRLRMENQLIEDTVDLVEHHLRFMHVQEMRESKLKRFLRKPNFAEHLELHRLDCLASHGMLDNYQFCKKKLEEFGAEKMSPPRLVTGHDLIALGLRAGPLFREILTDVEDKQLEGKIANREEALEYVKQRCESLRN